MKIAMVFDGLQTGGIERVGSDFANIFCDLNHEVTVINLVPEKKEMLYLFPPKINYVQYSYPRWLAPEIFTKYGYGDLIRGVIFKSGYLLAGICSSVLKRIYRAQFREKYDVVVAFAGHYNDLHFVADDFAEGNKKVAWLHGSENQYLEISSGYGDLYAKIRNLVCLSNYQDENVAAFNAENGIVKRKIYNPTRLGQKQVDAKFAENLRQQYGDFCLMVARMTKEKDHITAVKAMEYLKNSLGLDRKLLFVGEGSEREKVENEVKGTGMEGNVIFVGESKEVQNYYAAASIYVHSSPAEGLPTVLLEALSFGLPVAATDSVPGVREILGDSLCGLISPVRDHRALAENICRLYTDMDLRSTLLAKGKERIKDFSYDTIRGLVDKYLCEELE